MKGLLKSTSIIRYCFGVGHRKTESWGNNSDCCSWKGITCNAKSGEVVELDLRCSFLHGRFHSYSSLQNIPFLTTLDLSGNDFTGQIPDSIGNLFQLTSLSLSGNQFSGQIPSSFGNLNQLTEIYVGRNMLSGNFSILLLNLTGLTYLDISYNQFSGALPPNITSLSNLSFFAAYHNAFTGTIPSSLFTIPSLRYIDLSDNQFNGTLEFGNISSPSNLHRLFLGNNNFKGPIPRSISKFVNLEYLDLSHFDTQGGPVDFSIFSHFNSLSYLKLSNLNTTTTIDLYDILSYFKIPSTLDLSGNHVSTTNKSSVSNLLSLEIYELYLSGCDITEFPELLRTQHEMTTLDISNNKIQGQVPAWLWTLPNLTYVNLSNNTFIGFQRSKKKQGLASVGKPSVRHLLGSNNNFTGKIPSFICELRSLNTFDLSENNFNGSIPSCLRNLNSTLSVLNLRQNNLSGGLPEDIFGSLPNLTYVNLSNNTFIGFQRSNKKQGLSSVREPSVTYLLGSNNNFTGKIPSFICELRSLNILDLSENNFNGSIPLCMGNLKSNLSVLNLRQNNLSGGLPEDIFEILRSLDVGHNQLVGKLPRSLSHFSTLEVLNVESNRITGTFPFWLSSLPKLQVLVLRSNAFHGPIHQVFFPKLRIVDISHNHFNGTLPSDYFVKWSAMSSLGTDEDRSSVNYMGSGVYYQDSMVLMNKGVELELVRILTIYTAIDFSGNKFEGEIPKSIGLLKELHVLNLSNNAFTGHMPSSMGNLTALESLDVSRNKLSGEIPQELGDLSFLEYMNFSHNTLTGLVPGGTQFRTQHCSSFEGNVGLFGSSIDEVCGDIHMPASQQYETPHSEEVEEVISWIAAAIGFIPGIVFGLRIGYILL